MNTNIQNKKRAVQERLRRYLLSLAVRTAEGDLVVPRRYAKIPSVIGFAGYLRWSSKKLRQIAREDENWEEALELIYDLQQEELLQRAAESKNVGSLKHAYEQSEVPLETEGKGGLLLELVQYDTHQKNTDTDTA